MKDQDDLPQRADSNRGSSQADAEAHRAWIKKRILVTLSFYYVDGDPEIARGQAHQWARILFPYSRAEIDAAATRYEATEARKAPNPAAIVALIKEARKLTPEQVELRKQQRERAEMIESRSRRDQRPSPERAAEICREFGFNVVKRFDGGPA